MRYRHIRALAGSRIGCSRAFSRAQINPFGCGSVELPAYWDLAPDPRFESEVAANRDLWTQANSEYGEWIKMLRESGFVIDALHELYAPADAPDHPYYAVASAGWARRWPAEELWAAHLADLPIGTGSCESSDTRSPR